MIIAVYDEEQGPRKRYGPSSRRGGALEATDYEDACPIATVALEVASTDDCLRRATAEVFKQWTMALTERLGDHRKALAVIAALEGAFVLCRASQSTEPMLAAGEMAATLVTET